jgi:hypothetical protein
MMTEYEARKIVESMQKELNMGPRAVRQSTAGLLACIAFVLLGLVFPPSSDRSLDVAQAPADFQANVIRANTELPYHARPETQWATDDAVPVARLTSTSAAAAK